MLTHEAVARPNRVVARVFRAGRMKRLGLLCGGVHAAAPLQAMRSGNAPWSKIGAQASSATHSAVREQKANNVASTMGFGCGR
jgi:hypothetical protein